MPHGNTWIQPHVASAFVHTQQMLLCKPKWQYLFTWKGSSYCILALHSSIFIGTIIELRFIQADMLYSMTMIKTIFRLIQPRQFNPLTAKLFHWNFHSREVVSHWRDPQPQVSENYSDLTKSTIIILKYCWLMVRFIFDMSKIGYLMC